MEPDKFEKHINEALTEREIIPSDIAWKKIVGQMPKQEPKKTKTFFWYSVAAAFVGVLIVFALYFNRIDDVVDTGIQVVEVPREHKNTNESNLPVRKEEILEKGIPTIQSDRKKRRKWGLRPM